MQQRKSMRKLTTECIELSNKGKIFKFQSSDIVKHLKYRNSQNSQHFQCPPFLFIKESIYSLKILN